MKKLILFAALMLLITNTAEAGIFSRIFGFGNYNNGYYYPPTYTYTNSNYYRPPRYNNYYYNNTNSYYNRNPYRYNRYHNSYPNNHYRRPVILRTNVKRSMVGSNEKLVANQFSGIDKLEQKMLLQTYEYDSPKNRIERLEQRIFGASQQGNLAERFKTLKNVSKNYKAYNPDIMSEKTNYSAQNSYRPPIFTGSSGAGWQNTLWGNFKNQFVGMPTGYTPAMDPAYMDYFEAERAMLGGNGDSADIRTNHGYYRANTNRGTRTGVTILD